MQDEQLLRYSRHILLPEIGIEGQQTLLRSHALIIGCGGLGSPVALYLAASGVGEITLCDSDRVDLTNLQRQILHFTSAIGQTKVHSGCTTLNYINPEVRVIPIENRIEGELLDQLVKQVDIVVDASDNFPTRHAINRACVKNRKPLISGAALRFDGQITVFDSRDETSPCYQCLFPENTEMEEDRCATMGIFAPLAGIVGSIQAAETLKMLIGMGRSLKGNLLLFDSLYMSWRLIKLFKDQECSVCGLGSTTLSTTPTL